MKKKRLFVNIVVILFVFILGYLTSVLLVYKELVMDYKRGVVWERTVIWPFVVREDISFDTLDTSPINPDPDKCDLRVLTRYWGNQHIGSSRSYGVLDAVGELSFWLLREPVGASKIRRKFIQLLSSGKEKEAVKYARESVAKMRKNWEAYEKRRFAEYKKQASPANATNHNTRAVLETPVSKVDNTKQEKWKAFFRANKVKKGVTEKYALSVMKGKYKDKGNVYWGGTGNYSFYFLIDSTTQIEFKFNYKSSLTEDPYIRNTNKWKKNSEGILISIPNGK